MLSCLGQTNINSDYNLAPTPQLSSAFVSSKCIKDWFHHGLQHLLSLALLPPAACKSVIL